MKNKKKDAKLADKVDYNRPEHDAVRRREQYERTDDTGQKSMKNPAHRKAKAGKSGDVK